MPGELPSNNVERSVIVSELGLAFGRMRDDVKKPPTISGAANRFHGLIIRQIGLDDLNPSFEDQRQEFLQAGVIAHLQIPPMSFIYRYRRREKFDRIPDSPPDFFGTLESTADFVLRQEGVKRSEVLKADEVFKDATDKLDGGVPLLWTIAQGVDTILYGLNTKSIAKFDHDIKASIKTGPLSRMPMAVQRMTIADYFLLTGLHAYVDPATINRLISLSQEEYTYLLENEVELPAPPTPEEAERLTVYVRDLALGSHNWRE